MSNSVGNRRLDVNKNEFINQEQNIKVSSSITNQLDRLGHKNVEVLITPRGDISSFVHDGKEILLRVAQFPKFREATSKIDKSNPYWHARNAGNMDFGDIVSHYPTEQEAVKLIANYLENKSVIENMAGRGDDFFKKKALPSSSKNIVKRALSFVKGLITGNSYKKKLWDQYSKLVKKFHTTETDDKKNRDVIVQGLHNDGNKVGYVVVLPNIRNIKKRKLTQDNHDNYFDRLRHMEGYKLKFDSSQNKKIPQLQLQSDFKKGHTVVPPKPLGVRDLLLTDMEEAAKLQRKNQKAENKKILKKHEMHSTNSGEEKPFIRETRDILNTEPVFEEDEDYLRDYYNHMKKIDDEDWEQAPQLTDEDVERIKNEKTVISKDIEWLSDSHSMADEDSLNDTMKDEEMRKNIDGT